MGALRNEARLTRRGSRRARGGTRRQGETRHRQLLGCLGWRNASPGRRRRSRPCNCRARRCFDCRLQGCDTTVEIERCQHPASSPWPRPSSAADPPWRRTSLPRSSPAFQRTTPLRGECGDQLVQLHVGRGRHGLLDRAAGAIDLHPEPAGTRMCRAEVTARWSPNNPTVVL